MRPSGSDQSEAGPCGTESGPVRLGAINLCLKIEPAPLDHGVGRAQRGGRMDRRQQARPVVEVWPQGQGAVHVARQFEPGPPSTGRRELPEARPRELQSTKLNVDRLDQLATGRSLSDAY